MDSLNALSPMEFSIFVVVFTVLKVELLPGDLRFAQILLSSSSSWEDQDRKCELVCDVILICQTRILFKNDAQRVFFDDVERLPPVNVWDSRSFGSGTMKFLNGQELPIVAG